MTSKRVALAGVGQMVLSLCFCSGIEATEPGKGRFVVVPFNEGLDFFPGKWKITKEGTNGAYALVEVNDKSPREIEPHRHTREDEAWYVIEGELQFEIGEESATAGPGTFVYAPRDVRHCFKVTKVPARYLILFSPAGIEAFFSEVDELRKKLGEGTSEFRKLRDEVRAKYGVMPEEKRGSKSP